MASGALIFDTADDMLTAMFGPPQHDMHVQQRRQHLRFIEYTAWAAAADARLRAYVAEINARGK
ncbi:MAG: hypothetical protein KGL39_20170 [Patescibacteria group bacterium]|nr:hypothetical protein [Patescibacteria group bacterium]